ncbi:MAG: hypothetical protein QXR26_02275 [Candidatus Caldarchaeum sp.]
MKISRREFVKLIQSTVAVSTIASLLPEDGFGFQYIEPIDPSINPLKTYPPRDWERVYREL